MTLQDAFDSGFDAGYYGANMRNCHFSNFSTLQRTKAWVNGNEAGSYKREQKNKLKKRHAAKQARLQKPIH